MKAFICSCAGTQLSEAERTFFREARPFGFILFARNIDNPQQVRDLVEDFRTCVDRPDAPVFIDQEGGRVQRLRPPHWRAYPPAARYGTLFDHDPLAALRACRNVHRLLARELKQLGINADCLPVLDVPVPGSHEIIGDRAFHDSPQTAALLASTAIAGLRAEGVAPVIKHIPGHGRAGADSHEELPVVDASLNELRAHDFLPFAALADAPMAMTAHVIYSAIDARRPATTSAIVIQDIIRGELGFDGLLMSDDLNMQALSGPLGRRAEMALAAGCDVVLHCSGRLEEMREVAAACPELGGDALPRANEAMRAANAQPQPFPDMKQAEEWLARLLVDASS